MVMQCTWAGHADLILEPSMHVNMQIHSECITCHPCRLVSAVFGVPHGVPDLLKSSWCSLHLHLDNPHLPFPSSPPIPHLPSATLYPFPHHLPHTLSCLTCPQPPCTLSRTISPTLSPASPALSHPVPFPAPSPPHSPLPHLPSG
jgi:hypothetical protein